MLASVARINRRCSISRARFIGDLSRPVMDEQMGEGMLAGHLKHHLRARATPHMECCSGR